MYEIKQISEMKVATFEASYRRFIDKLIGMGFQIKNVMPINNNRYSIVFGTEKTIMFMFKREVFYNFGIMFRDKGYKGVGDSCNVRDLQKAIQYGVEEIYSCFPSGIVYKIPLNEFLEKSLKWRNKENKEIRSISIHEFTRWGAI